ncbi:carboxypeptidase-like regulatory domain-containing protein [Anseongella ginsenosidimutans]|uniref:carboxypeptidase-like regulatory domain-containing protein n=1 Tax=Anseongella ginsenosidimutans TaxID=496056 RepID=UPI0011C81F50|nr:carboxypeptidase-like regulatory domain-containing protein [Anseongella ginsenosidimutans]QEC53780.1 hypothetical protein FRZ59_16505 [Anseongella ginsenosidimutans]
MRKLLFTMLMLATCAAPSYAQTREVSGTVTDQESGAGLPGVAVQVQGAQGGTQTDIDGNYTLAVPPGR